MRALAMLLCAVALAGSPARAQKARPAEVPQSAIRMGVGAGLGVAAINATDVVNIVNSTPGALEKAPTFKAAAEFFGYASIPVNSSWLVKLDYGYVLASYNIAAQYGPAEYTLSAHLPCIVVHYVLHDGGLYSLKGGLGGGYHWGTLHAKYSTLDRDYTASGGGVLLDLEGNTALGEDLHMYLGVQVRWEVMGPLADSDGKAPAVTTDNPSLHWFGAGARLGLSYLF